MSQFVWTRFDITQTSQSYSFIVKINKMHNCMHILQVHYSRIKNLNKNVEMTLKNYAWQYSIALSLVGLCPASQLQKGEPDKTPTD